MVNAAHPGFARTDLIANGPGTEGFVNRLSLFLLPAMSHSAAGGALPQLYAATDPEAEKAGYYGPNGLFELKGPPGKARVAGKARDEAVAAQLWAISETLAGVAYPVLARAA
jgi:hypothetical protein